MKGASCDPISAQSVTFISPLVAAEGREEHQTDAVNSLMI